MQDKPHITLARKEDCCGCRSCEQICPRGCISMQEDFEGFRYPVVNETRCIHCGLCISHCPMIEEPSMDNHRLQEPLVYAARLKNDEILLQSSSGGMFTAFAEETLKKDGVVFGCELDENLVARLVCVSKKNDLARLRGSKYVASDPNTSFRQVKDYLKQNKEVLFTGTGCQIAGLRKFLGNDYPNLLTIEIICHGTPSQKLFSKHVEFLEQQLGEKIVSFRFRDKSHGWGLNYRMQAVTATKVYECRESKDPYFSSFLRCKISRPCCYECRVAKTERIADITVGDFWGIEIFHPDFYDKRGVSGILLNTKKGLNAFKAVKKDFEYINSSFAEFSYKNGHLRVPARRPACRSEIYKGIDELPYSQYSNKLCLHGKQFFFTKMKELLPKSVRLKMNRWVFKLKRFR